MTMSSPIVLHNVLVRYVFIYVQQKTIKRAEKHKECRHPNADVSFLADANEEVCLYDFSLPRQ